MPIACTRRAPEDASGPAAGALAALAIDLLDDGVVVVRATDFRIELKNRAAEPVLRRFGGGDRLPWPLIAAAHELASAAQPHTIEVAAPGGDRVHLRARALGPSRILIVIREGELREADLRRVLVQRFGLSARECDVVGHIRVGLRNQQIAQRMRVSLGTVKNYASQVFSALQVSSRTELMAAVEGLR